MTGKRIEIEDEIDISISLKKKVLVLQNKIFLKGRFLLLQGSTSLLPEK